MTLNEYQEQAYGTALPECKNSNYMILGVCNESGEVAGVVKKFYRGDFSEEVLREKMKKEIGDALWYLSGLAQTLELTLEEIGEANIAKLKDRHARGVVKGDGDNR